MAGWSRAQGPAYRTAFITATHMWAPARGGRKQSPETRIKLTYSIRRALCLDQAGGARVSGLVPSPRC